jgi:hypothetical protein
MIPEAGSCRKSSGNDLIWKQEYGARIRRQVTLNSGRFFPETEKTGHWIRTLYSCFHLLAISRGFGLEPVRALRHRPANLSNL